jgi:SAM-dependent methyltransferase
MLKSVLKVLRRERRRVPDARHRRALRAGVLVWQDYYGPMLIEAWKWERSFSGLLRLLRQYPCGVLRHGTKAIGKRALRRFMPRWLRFATRRRLRPASRCFGLDRGQPIDRYYIESFLARYSGVVRGRVLEIGDDAYSRKFGGERITRQDILHVVPGYPGATIIADLASAPHIPSAAFDCIILTQTLHYIFDLHSAVATLARILKPGGTLLVTLPGISQVCRDQHDRESDCWRFTAASAQRLFRRHFPAEDLQVITYGNVWTATAFLYGLAVEDLTPAELVYRDPDYPVTVAVSARKRNTACG